MITKLKRQKKNKKKKTTTLSFAMCFCEYVPPITNEVTMIQSPAGIPNF